MTNTSIIKAGDRSNMLVVVKELPPEHDGKRINRWLLVDCDCGNEKKVRLTSFKRSDVYSCGCYRKPIYKAGDTIGKFTVVSSRSNPSRKGSLITAKCHCGNIVEKRIDLLKGNERGDCGCGASYSKNRLSGTRLGNIWKQMMERCENPKAASYSRYGALGVEVCSEWRDFLTFHKWQMENGYSDDLEIDRHPDKDGNYCPSNVRWVTRTVNARFKRNSIWWTINGVDYESAQHAADQLSVDNYTILKWCKGVGNKGVAKPDCSWRWKYPDLQKAA